MGIGLLLGGEETDPQTAAADIRSALIEAAGSLEVAAVEYEESVQNGEVTRRTEYEGALAALESSRTRYEEVAPALEVLAPERADEVGAGFDLCEELITELADSTEVKDCLATLDEALTD
jgi:hypothetical protein